jgi:diketogulonate reductase-like aldo/keto reductase
MLDYPGPDLESVRGQWKAFEEMKSEGLVDSLAVSNFSARQLDAILSMGNGVSKPVVNQLPFSIAYHPPNILEYNKQRGVLVQSWSPLSRVLTNPTFRPKLISIGENYGKSSAQVGLRYIIQSGAAFCTQSKSKKHFEEDLNVFDFELSESEMAELNNLA